MNGNNILAKNRYYKSSEQVILVVPFKSNLIEKQSLTNDFLIQNILSFFKNIRLQNY